MKLYTIIALIAAASAIRVMQDDKKELKNKGRSSDVALKAGRKVAAKVVAEEKRSESERTTAHKASMDEAARSTTKKMMDTRINPNDIMGQQPREDRGKY